jgi:hypothetical protein
LAEDLGEELLHTRPGFRLFNGRDEAGDVYYAREYELSEDVDRDALALRLQGLSSLALPGLAPLKETQLNEDYLRIVQGEISGANLKTLLQWEPGSVTPERFSKWAFEFCLFLRELHDETDWTPSPIHLDQLMITPDDRLVVLAAGWEGLLKPSASNREAAFLSQFRDFTTPLLEHLDGQGHEVASLYWVFQHRCSCLEELRETLDQGAPFIPSVVDELGPVASFEIPEVEESRNLLGAFFSQSLWRLFLQFGLLVVVLVCYRVWTRPTPLPVQGVYVLCGDRVGLLNFDSSRQGTLRLAAEGTAAGLLDDPSRIAVAFRDQRRVDILDRSTGLVVDSFLAEGPVTTMVGKGRFLYMNQSGLPGVLVYDGQEQGVVRVLLTSPGVTSLALSGEILLVGCRDRNKLYSFSVPQGELLSQRDMSGVEVLGADQDDCYVSFDAGTKIGALESDTLKTRKTLAKDPGWTLTQVITEPGGDLLWAFSSTNGCTLLSRESLEPIDRQLLLPPKTGEALMLGLEETLEIWISLPEQNSIAIMDGQKRSLRMKAAVPGTPSVLLSTRTSGP